MSEMELKGQLDDFAGEPADYDRDTGEVQDAKPRRRSRSDKGKPHSKHVDAFSTGQPIPGEEPPPPAMAGVPQVYTAISAITADIMRTGIGKTHRNSQQGYSFRGIDDVYNMLPPLLVKHGLIILSTVEDRTVTERPAKGGGLLICVNVKMAFELISTRDGSRERVSSFGEAMDSGDKATNKALSTAYKYMAMQTFCIPTIGIDPEEDTYEVTGTHSPVSQQPPTVAEMGAMLVGTEHPKPAGPSPSHVKLLVELAAAKALGGQQAFAEWFRSLEPEDRETVRQARRSATTEARH